MSERAPALKLDKDGHGEYVLLEEVSFFIEKTSHKPKSPN